MLPLAVLPKSSKLEKEMVLIYEIVWLLSTVLNTHFVHGFHCQEPQKAHLPPFALHWSDFQIHTFRNTNEFDGREDCFKDIGSQGRSWLEKNNEGFKCFPFCSNWHSYSFRPLFLSKFSIFKIQRRLTLETQTWNKLPTWHFQPPSSVGSPGGLRRQGARSFCF